MRAFLVLFLLSYFTVYVFATFVWRSYQMWKQTGVNPYALGNTDSAYDFIGVLFRMTLIAVLLTVLSYALLPDIYPYFTSIIWLEQPQVVLLGISVLLLSLVWVFVAQIQMGASWRIGIDTTHSTKLVQRGVFRWSRNPIFLGMRLTLLGFFLVLPSAITLAILLVSEVLIHIQVRLEEAFLLEVHGKTYQAYKQQTRRWL